MTGLYVLCAVTLTAALTAVVLLAVLLRKKTQNQPASNAELPDLRGLTTEAADRIIINTTAQLGTQSSNTDAKLDVLRQALDSTLRAMRDEDARRTNDLRAELSRTLQEQRVEQSKNFAEFRASNEAQIRDIRKTVDEKLQSTISERFSESFGVISRRMEELQNGFSAMKELEGQVSGLNKVFANVKSRGSWGEVSLELLLSDILTPDQYSAQYKFSRSDEGGVVDFVIRMPGKGDGEKLLPVDSKFPTEDFQRLVAASDDGNKEQTEFFRKAFLAAVEKAARDIKNKYIKPGITTDFAVLYLPVESMYAEVVRAPGFIEKLLGECRIVIAGPTTFSALLTSLRIGFRTVALEKSSAEIRKAFEQFVKDFGSFSGMLDTIRKQLGTVSGTIEKADARTQLIRKRLSKFRGELNEEEEGSFLEDVAADDTSDDSEE